MVTKVIGSKIKGSIMQKYICYQTNHNEVKVNDFYLFIKIFKALQKFTSGYAFESLWIKT